MYLFTSLVLGSWEFGVIGDTQARPWVFKEAISHMQIQKHDFYVHLGDIHWRFSLKIWAKRKALMDTLKRPWWVCFGNHEFMRSKYSNSYCRKKFVELWYGNGDTLRIWKHKGWYFVVLDTASHTIPRGHYSRIKAFFDRTSGPVMIFSHRPLAHPKSVYIARGVWSSTLDPPYYGRRNRRLWELLVAQKNRIGGLFHGHYHGFLKYKIGPFQVYCSGGGGGTLQRYRVGRFYHYLTVNIHGKNPTDYVVGAHRIKRNRRRAI